MKIQQLGNGKYKVTVEQSSQTRTGDDTLPFKNTFSGKAYEAVLSENEDITPKAEVAYKKRGGGVYIYSNNPEMLNADDIGCPLLRNSGLSGECFFTYEHSNHSGQVMFLGYQLMNEGDKPVRVTVLNIGNQVRGEWLGQREWCDFYSLKFDLPYDYFNADGKTVNPIYVGGDYVDYTPQKYTPEVFEIPVGGYLWVIGGTSGDKPFGSLSGKTADQAVLCGKCANGAVRFIVEGGSVTGTFWCYTQPSECDPSKPEQGYVTTRGGKNYAAQYKGIDKSTVGLAEAEICFIFGDMTASGRLPVTYKVRRDPDCASVKGEYAEYSLKEFTVDSDRWLTSLNPNNAPAAIGTDMIAFECVTTDGKRVVIDTESNDGEGRPANIGNWMMENGTNFIFANSGKRDRRLKLYARNTGVLAVIVRNDCGEILEKKLIMQPYNFGSESEIFAGVDKSLLVEKNGRLWFKMPDGRPFCDVWDERSFVYELEVKAGETVRLSVDDLILANSCGGVFRWVEID